MALLKDIKGNFWFHKIYDENIAPVEYEKILEKFKLEKLPKDRMAIMIEDENVDELAAMGETAAFLYYQFVVFYSNDYRIVWRSLKNISDDFQISRSTIHRALKKLEKAGFIECLSNSQKGSCYIIKK